MEAIDEHAAIAVEYGGVPTVVAWDVTDVPPELEMAPAILRASIDPLVPQVICLALDDLTTGRTVRTIVALKLLGECVLDALAGGEEIVI